MGMQKSPHESRGNSSPAVIQPGLPQHGAATLLTAAPCSGWTWGAAGGCACPLLGTVWGRELGTPVAWEGWEWEWGRDEMGMEGCYR